jgi:hypothetical protein
MERLIGAACTLDAAGLRERLAAWRELRTRAVSVDEIPGGIRLALPGDGPLEEVMRLVEAESECCPFYRFTVTVAGPDRWLEIDAGTGAAPAVRALLGLRG